nr:hypothetical protein [Methanophagales archaeon]
MRREREREKREEMKICPMCGSKNLKYMPWLGEIYECKDCGFRGSFVVEDGELVVAGRESEKQWVEEEKRKEGSEEEEREKRRKQ